MGPATLAPVRFALTTISLTDWSSRRWSKDCSRILIFSILRSSVLRCLPYDRVYRPRPAAGRLLENLGDGPCANGPAALADGETQGLLHGDVLDELDLEANVVARHDHFDVRRQLHGP